MHGGGSAPSCCAFTHRVAFEEESGHGSLSRAGRAIGGVRHVALPMWLVSNFLVRPVSSCGAPGRPGNPSRPRWGIDSPVAIRRGEGAQMKQCRDPRCSPRGNPACQGLFGSRMKAGRDRLALQGGTGDFPRDAVAGKGLILPSGGNHVVFLELRLDSRVSTGISGFLLGWPWEAQSSPRISRESWGLRSSHCRAEETSPRRVSGT